MPHIIMHYKPFVVIMKEIEGSEKTAVSAITQTRCTYMLTLTVVCRCLCGTQASNIQPNLACWIMKPLTLRTKFLHFHDDKRREGLS